MNMTISFIIINVSIYFIMEFVGATGSAAGMVQYGAMQPVLIQEGGEYWRFFTATLMHFDFIHLLNNMVVLAVAGKTLERALDKVKYTVLYFISGIGGCILSYMHFVNESPTAISAGASGSISGIIGALAWILILHKGKYKGLTGKGMIMMIIINLYTGIATGTVDNWAHAGGFVVGFLLSLIFYKKKEKRD